jgi:hypothetical protein
VPHWQNSASLEGWWPPRVRFCLARGLDAPSSGILPRLGAKHPLERGPVSIESRTPPRVRFRLTRGPHGPATSIPAPPTGAFNAPTFAGAQAKDESTPLARLGITPRCYSANSRGEAIPTTVRRHVVRPGSTPRPCATHSHTAGTPHPRERTAEPSKGGGRLSCARAGPCHDVGRVPSVTISRVRPCPPPRRHPGHCSAIFNAVETHGNRTSPHPLLCLVRPPVSGTLESARGQPPNGRPPHCYPRSRS